MFTASKKINLIILFFCFFFLRYYKDITNLLVSVLWASLGMTSKNGYYQLLENFDVYLHAKSYLSHLFLEILQRYCKLFILSNFNMPGHDHQKLHSTNLKETLIFISKQKLKLNLIPQFI